VTEPPVEDVLPAPSASGARLTGDDLQHLIGWYFALRTLRPENGIAGVRFESRGAGNLDDIVVRYTTGLTEYMQVKAVVSAETALNSEWLLAPGRSNGPSILTRFWRSWLEIREAGGDAELWLVTNRSIDPGDPVLRARDERDLLADRLRQAAPGSRAAVGRAEWAAHLGIPEDQLLDLLDVVHWSTDASESTWRRQVVDVGQGLGLRGDEAALLAGVGQVRAWIRRSRIERTADDVRQAVEKLQLRVEEPYGVIVIQALERQELPETVEALDWVDRFAGGDPRTRRGLRRPAEWNAVLLPELRDACQRARQRNRRVMVRGAMRLPTWFAVGTELTEVAGACPATSQGGQIWSADDRYQAPLPEVLVMDEQDVGSGEDLAITIDISAAAAEDVVEFLRGHGEVGTHLTVSLSPGPGRIVIGSSAEAIAAAVAIRNEIRSIVRSRGVRKIHLFLMVPGALGLLLGHLWDRMPLTQTYEDLVTNGYEPAFLISN
jgi:hypothetical protein